jgi:hypothetical protein
MGAVSRLVHRQQHPNISSSINCTESATWGSVPRGARKWKPKKNQKNLERSIMKRQAIPDTIDEWQSAAREEVKRALVKHHLAKREGGDTDAAQTGVIRLTRSEEERTRLMAEGRCFECYEKGHRARDCPDKLEGENIRN